MDGTDWAWVIGTVTVVALLIGGPLVWKVIEACGQVQC